MFFFIKIIIQFLFLPNNISILSFNNSFLSPNDKSLVPILVTMNKFYFRNFTAPNSKSNETLCFHLIS